MCIRDRHYHELTALSNTFEGLSNLSLEAKDWNGELIFLHKVIEGAADRSYGVHVAKIAGLPPIAAVSYTHLDVYKRQIPKRVLCPN